MDAGRLRHRVMLQQATTVPDDTGGFDKSWATVATLWALVRVLKSTDETLMRDALAGVQHWNVTLRHRDGVSLGDRVLWEGHVLEVEAVQPDPLEQWLTVRCREERVA